MSQPISISVTLGALEDALKSYETYGSFLRSFDAARAMIEDEPSAAAETVLTLNLAVTGDLEPIWTLVSERAAAHGQTRYLTWSDRLRLSPTRIGVFAAQDLAWRRGSVLNRLSDEKVETSGALAEAGRQARAAFGEIAGSQLADTLRIVGETARYLGVEIGEQPKALLDAHTGSSASTSSRLSQRIPITRSRTRTPEVGSKPIPRRMRIRRRRRTRPTRASGKLSSA